MPAAAPEKQPINVYLFYGEDTYSSAQKLELWRKRFEEKYGGETNIEILDGKTLNPAEFDTNINAMPFLAEKKLIIIKNFLAETKSKAKADDKPKPKSSAKAEAQRKVAETIEETPDFCLVIFHETEMPDRRSVLFQKINKVGKAEEFQPLSPNEISKWIISKSIKDNFKISLNTSLYLSTYLSQNLWLIENELNKLSTYANGKEITREMIDSFVLPTLSSSIFKLTDNIAVKNLKESLRIFNILIESGEDPIMIFFMIVRHFRILIQVQEMVEKRETQATMIKRLKQHPFVVQTMSRQAKNFSTEKIEQIYKKLLEIDRKVKTGIIKSYAGNTSEFELAIEKLMIDCCK